MKNNLWKTWLSFNCVNFALLSNTYRLVFLFFYLVFKKILIVCINRIVVKEHACSEEDTVHTTQMLKQSQLYQKEKALLQEHGSTECMRTCTADLLHLQLCVLEDGNGFSFFKCMKYQSAVCSLACKIYQSKRNESFSQMGRQVSLLRLQNQSALVYCTETESPAVAKLQRLLKH